MHLWIGHGQQRRLGKGRFNVSHSRCAPGGSPPGWRLLGVIAVAVLLVPALALPASADAAAVQDSSRLTYVKQEPSAGAGAEEAQAAAGEQATIEAVADPQIDGSVRYPVRTISVVYCREHPQHPSLRPLAFYSIPLGEVKDGYVARRKGVPSTFIRLGSFTGDETHHFYGSAIRSICEAIVEYLNKQGLVGVFAAPNEKEIDPRNAQDLREPSNPDLQIVVWTTVITQARTTASGERIPAAERYNSPLHASILSHSPVQPLDPAKGGERKDLLLKSELDDYVFRLNRHPGRRVDVAVSSAGKPGEGSLDYLVTENKQWLVFAQASNTGTKETTDWRERFGFVHNQVSNRDDLLSVDYTTGDFDAVHAVIASYEAPFLWDPIRWRAYGIYSQYDASDVGITAVNFTGQEQSAGCELITNIYQHKQTFVDVAAGFQWRNIEVTNETLSIGGEGKFALPYASLTLARRTDTATTAGEIGVEYNSKDLGGTDAEDAETLGRTDVDDTWYALKADLSQSFFIEPLFKVRDWEQKGLKGASMAHELVFSIKGQYAGGYRLIPQAEEVIGGRYTVRGYPESVASGDSAVAGSMEYRYHFPRALAPNPYPKTRLFGRPFRWRPQAPLTRPDWDLVFSAFADAGRTYISSKSTFENEEKLAGVGAGVEFQLGRYFNVRMDYGVALEGTEDDAVERGDTRLHVVATFVW